MTDRQWDRLTYLAAGTVAAFFVARAMWLTFRIVRLSAQIAAFRDALDPAGVAHEGLQVIALRESRMLAWLLVVLAPAVILALATAVRRTVRP